jgi:hypothetical protein
VAAVVLGPSERAYWRLCEPLWERVGLAVPRLIPRPSVFVIPKGFRLETGQLEALKKGDWDQFATLPGTLPSERFQVVASDPTWSPELQQRFQLEQERSRKRLGKLDRRLHRDAIAHVLGGDPERLRQTLFPFGAPQERVLPAVRWLRNDALLDAILERMRLADPVILVEEP